MGRTKDLLIDAWSALAYKQPLADEVEARRKGWESPSWVPSDARRRLAAYTVLAAYESNSARVFLEGDDEDRDSNREYGDAALVIDQVLAHLLGESQEIVVSGAEDAADLIASATAAAADATEEDEEGGDVSDPDVADEDLAEAEALVARQEWLRRWAEQVHLPLRLVDGERQAVQYGDGVYLLGWDDARSRPTVAVMDPGFYFPVLPDSLDAYAYPEKVHFAWELPGEDFPDGKTRVRRLTYELGPLVDGIRWLEEDGDPVLPEGASWDEHGRLVRLYPWDEQPSEQTCYLTDATWLLDDVKGGVGFDGLTPETAMYRTEMFGDEVVTVDRYDLGIDFIPVVHVPNTPAGGQHFGQSSISRALQVLDDLQAADTDSQRASSTAGSPIIGLSGQRVAEDREGRRSVTVAPGVILELGDNGKLSTVDTSAALSELRQYVDTLRDRLSTNTRLPAAILGTLDPSDVPSGYSMQLSFGPLSSMIRTMRLTRGVKHPLILRMAQRLAQANEVLPAGPTPHAELRLGAFLPSDQSGTLKVVREAYEAGIISLTTALQMLTDVGFPIADIAAEVAAINGRDFEGANRLADAIGDLQAVYDFLGIEREAEEVVTPVQLGDGSGPPVPSPGTGNGAS